MAGQPCGVQGETNLNTIIETLAPRVELAEPGRWQDRIGLEGFERWHSLITDPPYSERTHGGARGGGSRDRARIGYEPLGLEDVRELVSALWPRTDRWWVAFGDHVTVGWMLAELEAMPDAFVYPPVPWIATDGAPRRNGDGPSPGVQWIAIARRRRRARPGELFYRPSHYQGPGPRRERASGGVYGAKPSWLAAALVNDYSRPGDVVCDPFAGSGTILEAAIHEGRTAIGCEVDADRHALAVLRVQRASPRWCANFAPRQTQLSFPTDAETLQNSDGEVP